MRLIQTEQEYDTALARIAELMHVEEGTPESDELMKLVTLVETYEEIHWPIDPPDPIEAARFRAVQEEP